LGPIVWKSDNCFSRKRPKSLTENYRIIEEQNANGNEDTERMLKQGASRVFRIKTKSEYLHEAIKEFLSKYPAMS